MNLRKEITLGVLLIIFILLVYSAINFWTTNSERTTIKDFIIEDLKNKHPNAEVVEILIMNLEKNEDDEDYYYIKAKVTEGLTTPCPTRIHYHYNYPEQNFITQPPEYITKDCEFCEVTPCAISFEEEAIIASHTLEGTEEIAEFVEENEDAYPTVTKESEGWRVIWLEPDGEGFDILLSSDGDVLELNKIFNEN